MRILLVDHRYRCRETLRHSLENCDKKLKVVGEAANGKEALARAEEVLPDIVVMDICLPGSPALEVSRLLKKSFPHVKVVILSKYMHPLYLNYAFHCGASGYVYRESRDMKALKDELLAALEKVREGKDYISPAILPPEEGRERREQNARPMSQVPEGKMAHRHVRHERGPDLWGVPGGGKQASQV